MLDVVASNVDTPPAPIDSDLRLHGASVGSHGIPFDLSPWLYRGGASTNRLKVVECIRTGALGYPLAERRKLIERLQEVLQADVTAGRSIYTLRKKWYLIASFISWCEEHFTAPLNLSTLEKAYLIWADHLWHCANITKVQTRVTAHDNAKVLGAVFVDVLDLRLTTREGVCINPLLARTRLRAPSKGAPASSKVRMTDAETFGRFLVSLCTSFTHSVITGALPFELKLPNGKSRHWPQYVLLDSEVASRRRHHRGHNLFEPMQPGESITVHQGRMAMANLRMEAEQAIFIAQTGMNLSQAQRLERDKFRWQSSDADVLAFRVYKGRRSGEAVFRAYKEYRHWFTAYIEWLEAIAPNDHRLFPFYSNGRIAPVDTLREQSALKKLCKFADIPYIGARASRNLRQNWLLRLIGRPDLTATMGAHSKRTLLGQYEKPHHQAAAARITLFHEQHDPALAPGPGLCADPSHTPAPEEGIQMAAPTPDCISPEGCLFCVHHRDVLSFDYVWKLSSHAHLKALERDDYENSVSGIESPHPADVVIDRIRAKIDEIKTLSNDGAPWVEEAEARVWEGRFHDAWSGFIELWEAMN